MTKRNSYTREFRLEAGRKTRIKEYFSLISVR